MSLPSGLIFFLDFQADPNANQRLGTARNDSLFGGGVVGQQITGGVDLGGVNAEKSFYALNNGYSSPTGTIAASALTIVASGTFGNASATTLSSDGMTQAQFDRILRFDADLTSGTSTAAIGVLPLTGTAAQLAGLNKDDLVAITIDVGGTLNANGPQLRRLTQFSGTDAGLLKSGEAKDHALIVVADVNGARTADHLARDLTGSTHTVGFPIKDEFGNVSRSDAEGAVVGATPWNLEDQAEIPEIDIKVDSVSVTAVTKKLKAKWTPELGQDLNAYHNLDAEVELTSILSEQIALEIDQEILNDLIKGATGGTLYWSRLPGNFVNRETGAGLEQAADSTGFPEFTGTVSEWYETLVETINDVSARIHRKTLRGGANFIVVAPEVANLLEFTSGFRANVTADDTKGTVGAVNTGNLSKKWDVFVDPYFLRNLVLVGRRGSSFLESGFVYAPYVPLQVTPTIFGPEDFVPRKGVMTRYAKKMVRPDMYGLVVVEDLV